MGDDDPTGGYTCESFENGVFVLFQFGYIDELPSTLEESDSEINRFDDLMDTDDGGALARWQINLKRYANQIRRSFPTVAATLSLVCTEMEAARKSIMKEKA